jgi:hypothetical protein
MMKISRWLAIVLLFAACGGGGTTTGPTPTDQGFLTGRWTGTVVIQRTGIPDSTAATEWQLAPVPFTNGSTYSGTAIIRDRWLPVTVDVKTLVLPPEPGGKVGTTGFYPSPRGCTGIFSSDGIATATTITGTISGGDCDEEPSTFRGSIHLTKRN